MRVMAIVPRRACWLWGGPFLLRSSEVSTPASSMLRLTKEHKHTLNLSFRQVPFARRRSASLARVP